MTRGRLRVYLGSAPGVGKTYRMLDEGWRRKERGTDVVVGFVETHGRTVTEAQLRDLEVVARTTREYRGTSFEEMDLDAILARAPRVVLVDELAHTNVPGGRNPKRWQDVDNLLDAGIDVITTVNIQHLESVNDVVEKITGITQHETVPDAVVRRAEQVELVDITPEALRRRMAHGNVYAADKIDASLSNYFRTGNLSALREIALLWLADRVEDALQRYQDDHEIAATWETRERLIVGVTGSDIDEVLLRRAARISSRTGAVLVSVHVVNADAQYRSLDTTVARTLTQEFEGSFHEIVDDDVARALVAFARAERGTQIVLGASRARRALHRHSGVVEDVLHHARDLDVHIIAVGAIRPARVRPRRQKRGVSWRRSLAGLVLSGGVLALLSVTMTAARSSLSLSTAVLVYLVAVLGLSAWGGVLVGVLAAFAAAGLENYYLVQPLHTLDVARPDDLVALVTFLLFALAASVVVNRFTAKSAEADRARAEARILAKAVTTGADSPEDLRPLLDSLRTVFSASSVTLQVRHGDAWTNELVSGDDPDVTEPANLFAIGDDRALTVRGATLDAQDRQLVDAFGLRIAAGLRSLRIVHDAAQLRVIAEAEALRMGMMRSVSDDLAASLSTIETKMDQLPIDPTTPAHEELRTSLETIASELRRLTRLHVNLRDVSRLETGTVAPQLVSIAVHDLVRMALRTVTTNGRTIDIDLDIDLELDADLAPLRTDPDMASRVLAVVVDNAVRFSPRDQPVRISAGATTDLVEILVIDRGPGMKPEDQAAVFDPFRHVGNRSGADLGLAVASGFMRVLGGQLRFEDTPGGGLTVVIEFPRTVAAHERASEINPPV